MKKLISLVLILMMLFTSVIPSVAVDTEKAEAQPQWEDVVLEQSELDYLIESNEKESRATGLINSWSIGCTKSGSNLIIVGTTNCTTQVVKCGFKEVIIQRRKNSSYSWSDYLEYNNLYDESYSYTLSKSVAVPSGYQYRVTCVHYAKKSLLSVEKISNTSAYVQF